MEDLACIGGSRTDREKKISRKALRSETSCVEIMRHSFSGSKLNKKKDMGERR